MAPSRIALIDCTDGTGHHARYGAEVARALRDAGQSPVAIGTPGWCQSMAQDADGIPIDWRFPTGQTYMQRNRAFRQFCRLVISACLRENIPAAHFLYIDGFLGALANTWDGYAPRISATLHWYPFLSRSALSPSGLKQRTKGLMTLHWMKQLARKGVHFSVHARQAQKILLSHGISHTQFLRYPNFDNTIARTATARYAGRHAMGLKEDDRLFLCFGGTRNDKGCDLAVKAIAGTPTSCHLLIAGSANDFSRSTLERLARDLGVESRVHLDIRHIPDDELERIFSSCDAVVLPYRHTFSGQSGPLVTAISLDLPVIASRLQVFEETLIDYQKATLVPAENVSALADALARATASLTSLGVHPSDPAIDELALFRAGVRTFHARAT